MEKEREEKDAEIYWSYWITNELHPIYPDEPRFNQKEMSIWNELYGVWTSFNQLINMFLVKQASKSSSKATAHSTRSIDDTICEAYQPKHLLVSMYFIVINEQSPHEISANRSLARKSSWKLRAASAVHLHHFQDKKGGWCSGRTWTGGPPEYGYKSQATRKIEAKHISTTYSTIGPPPSKLSEAF